MLMIKWFILTFLLINWILDWLIDWLIDSHFHSNGFIHSFFQSSHTHSFIHSFIHSLIWYFNLTSIHLVPQRQSWILRCLSVRVKLAEASEQQQGKERELREQSLRQHIFQQLHHYLQPLIRATKTTTTKVAWNAISIIKLLCLLHPRLFPALKTFDFFSTLSSCSLASSWRSTLPGPWLTREWDIIFIAYGVDSVGDGATSSSTASLLQRRCQQETPPLPLSFNRRHHRRYHRICHWCYHQHHHHNCHQRCLWTTTKKIESQTVNRIFFCFSHATLLLMLNSHFTLYTISKFHDSLRVLIFKSTEYL